MATLVYHGDSQLVGGWLCLDFANTFSSRGKDGEWREYLTSYHELAAWVQHAGLLGAGQAEALAEQAVLRTTEAQAALERAISLRKAIYKLVSDAARQQPNDSAALELLNRELATGMAHARLIASDEGYIWGWPEPWDRLDTMLGPIARSAAELLSGPRLARVHICDNTSCSWLFLDTSKNHSRRWCSMDDCGNRAKARRHYQRKRAS